MDQIINEIEFYQQRLKEAKAKLYSEKSKKDRFLPRVIHQVITDKWSAYHGDCVEVLKGIPSNSIHYSIFSPPFSSLFTYSASAHDMGNSTDEEFYDHFEFLIPELYRVLLPGRVLSFHCSDIPAMKERDGYMGAKDFPGKLLRKFEAVGFIYHSPRITIWKDPLLEAVRTKALRLAHKQISKDSTRCGAGGADYIISVVKPGNNPEPIPHGRGFEEYIGEREEPSNPKNDNPAKNKYSHHVWQRYASPVWMDIRQGNTLNIKQAREKDDERHICLASGALVLTRQKGYVPIENIEIGDFVLTHKGRWRAVTGKKCNGIKPIILICAHGVADLRVTPEHEFWFRSPIGKGRWPGMKGSAFKEKSSAMKNDPMWVPARNTKGGYLNLKLPPIENSLLTSDEWWIVGRWLGDGHRGGHHRSGKRGGMGQFFISCSYDEVESLIKRLGKHAGYVAKHTACQIALKELRHDVRDVLNRCGNGAANKKLPGEAVTLSQEGAESLLSGYLSADGHYVKKCDRWTASSISRALLLGMELIVQRARGFVASVYAGRPEGKCVIQGRIVNTSQDWVFAFRNSKGYRQSGWIGEDGAWKKVRKIEEKGKSEVWDISVDEDESFTAEGAIVKNCPLQLDVIARCLELWTNPGDIVLSPFGGIGSEGYETIRRKRKFIGIELKKAYYRIMVRNLKQAEKQEQRKLNI